MKIAEEELLDDVNSYVEALPDRTTMYRHVAYLMGKLYLGWLDIPKEESSTQWISQRELEVFPYYREVLTRYRERGYY